MSIALPLYPGPVNPRPFYRDFGGVVTPIMGGVEQRLNRLGDRFGCEYDMPPMPDEYGRVWVIRLLRAQREGAVMRWPTGTPVGVPGSPVVDGAGQAGSAIALRGFSAAYQMREGQPFSIIHSGRRYLHFASATTTAGADGRMTLPIFPMLRVKPGSASICEVARPMIEGFLEGNQRDWTVDIMRNVGVSFRISESE